MDEKPFLIFDLENIDEYSIPEIKRRIKTSFDVISIVNNAGELTYLNQMICVIVGSKYLMIVAVFTEKVYDRPLTAKAKLFFTDIVEKVCEQFLNERINDRLKSIIIEVEEPVQEENPEIMTG